MISPQKRVGMVVRYEHKRFTQLEHHLIDLGDTRLCDWVSAFRPFMGIRSKMDIEHMISSAPPVPPT